MLYISVVMGALVGFLTDKWLERAGLKDNLRLIIAIVVALVVGFLTYNGHVPAF